MKMYYTEDEKSLLTEDELKNIFTFTLFYENNKNNQNIKKRKDDSKTVHYNYSEVLNFSSNDTSNEYVIYFKNNQITHFDIKTDKIILNKNSYDLLKSEKMRYDLFTSTNFQIPQNEESINLKDKTLILE